MESLSDSIQAAIRNSTLPPAGEHVPTAKDIMVGDGLITVRPDQKLSEVLKIMVDNRISGAPVVEPKMKLVGIISEFDCLRVVAAGAYEGAPLDGNRTVEELMSTNVITISPDLNLYGIAHVFITRKVRRLPVVRDGQVVGQVSRRDVLKAMDKMI